MDVFGHSYGGRCALGAALRTDAIRRVVSYEGAPTPPGERYGDDAVLSELRRFADAGDHATLLATFMRRVVGMPEADLAAYRDDPVWPVRVAAAPRSSASWERRWVRGRRRSRRWRRSASRSCSCSAATAGRNSRAATRALDARLADGRVVVIPGARHAAHHTHPDAVVAAVTGFLAAPM